MERRKTLRKGVGEDFEKRVGRVGMKRDGGKESRQHVFMKNNECAGFMAAGLKYRSLFLRPP